jgi:antitoxin MazE
LENDSLVEVSLVEGQIVIRPKAAPARSLEELLAGIHKTNLHHETDTGQAKGREVW